MSYDDKDFDRWVRQMSPCVMNCESGPESITTVAEDINSIWISDRNVALVMSKIIQCSQCDQQTAKRYANKEVMTEFVKQYKPSLDYSEGDMYSTYIDLDIMINDFVSHACSQISSAIDKFGTESLYRETPLLQNIPFRTSAIRRRTLADVEKYMYTHNTLLGRDIQESYVNPIYRRERRVNPFMSS